MSQVAGMKTKQIYDSACSTAESLLGLDSVLSVQEVAVRLGFGHLATQVFLSTSNMTLRLFESLQNIIAGCLCVENVHRPPGQRSRKGSHLSS